MIVRASISSSCVPAIASTAALRNWLADSAATGGATDSSPIEASSSWGALDPSVSATSASAGARSVVDRSAGCACSPPLVRGRALRRGAGFSSGASSSSELTVCWARRCDNTTHPATSPIEVRHMVMTTTPTTLVRSLLIFARLCSDSSRRCGKVRPISLQPLPLDHISARGGGRSKATGRSGGLATHPRRAQGSTSAGPPPATFLPRRGFARATFPT